MNDHTNKVTLDTTDYERPLKQLLGVVQDFNRETERSDRIQKLISESTDRTSNMYNKYLVALDKVEKAQLALASSSKKSGKEFDALVSALDAAKEKFKEVDFKDSGIAKLSPAVKAVSEDLRKAKVALDDFHNKYKHFGELKGMDFGFANKLQEMGADPQLVSKAKSLVEDLKKAYLASWTDPAFQEAMRIDKVIGSSKEYFQEFKQGFRDVSTSMDPYIQKSAAARKHQEDINSLLRQEASLRGRLAKTSDPAKQASLEAQLMTVGGDADAKMERLRTLATRIREKTLTDLASSQKGDLSGLGLSYEDQITHDLHRRRLETALKAAGPKGQEEMLANIYNADPVVAAGARQTHAGVFSAAESLRKFEEQKREEFEYVERQREWNRAAFQAHIDRIKEEIEYDKLKAQWDNAARQADKQAQTEADLRRNREIQWEVAARMGAKADRMAEIERNNAINRKQQDVMGTDAFANLTPISKSADYGRTIIMTKHADEVAAAFARSNIPLAHFAETIDRIRRSDQALIRQIPEVASALRRLDVAAHEADNTMHKMSISGESIARLTMARALTHVFYGLTAEMYRTWDAANAISKKVAEIQSISQVLPLNTRQWTAAIRDLSTEYGFAQQDVAKSLYETVSNQVGQGQQAIDFNKVAAPFAILTGSNLTDSVNLISAALNSFNLDASEAERIAAGLFATIDKGRVTATEMSNTLGRLGNYTQAASIPIEEMEGAIALLTISGVKFERASTFIINVMNKLAKPTVGMKQFFAENGWRSATDAQAQVGFQGILRALFNTTQGNLEDLSPMSQDIRATIGFAGLMKDLDQLEATVDYIANDSLTSFKSGVENSMKSSAQIMAQEGAKITATFIDMHTWILNNVAALSQLGRSTVGIGLADAMQIGTVLAGGFGLSTLGAGGRMAALGGMNKADILTRGRSQFEAAASEGTKLGMGQRIAKRAFDSATIGAVAGGAKGAIPGIGDAALLYLPQILGSLTMLAGTAALLYAKMPTIEKFLAEQFHGDIDLPETAKKNFEAISKSVKEMVKESKEGAEEAVRNISIFFSDIANEQERIMSNYQHSFEKTVDLIERKNKAESNILGGTGDFLLDRNNQDVEETIKSLRRPEDRVSAKIQYLASQRNTISSVVDTDPELAEKMFSSWIGSVSSLRGEIYSMAQENPGRKGQAGNFLNITDQMTNEFIGAVAQQLGVTGSGNDLQDILNIRQEVRERDDTAKQFSELKKFIEDNLRKGLVSWEAMEAGIGTLNETQQALFQQYFGDGSGDNSLANYIGQKNIIGEAEQLKVKAMNQEKRKDYLTQFPDELQKMLDLTNKDSPIARLNSQLATGNQHLNLNPLAMAGGGVAGGAAGMYLGATLGSFIPIPGVGTLLGGLIGAGIGTLGMGYATDKLGTGPRVPQLEQQQELVARINKWSEGAAEQGVTQDLAVEAKNILEAYRTLNIDTFEALKAQSEDKWANRFGFWQAESQAARLGESEKTLNDMVYRAGIFAGPDAERRAPLLRGLSSNFTEEQRQILDNAINNGEYGVDRVDLNTANVIMDVGELNINPRDVNFSGAISSIPTYQATGGPIHGPRGTDTVPAWLTPGEYVVNARSAAKHYGLLEHLNRGQYYADGGHVNSYQARFGDTLDNEGLKEYLKNRRNSQGNVGPRKQGVTINGVFHPYHANEFSRFASINGEIKDQSSAELDSFFSRYAGEIANAKGYKTDTDLAERYHKQMNRAKYTKKFDLLQQLSVLQGASSGNVGRNMIAGLSDMEGLIMGLALSVGGGMLAGPAMLEGVSGIGEYGFTQWLRTVGLKTKLAKLYDFDFISGNFAKSAPEWWAGLTPHLRAGTGLLGMASGGMVPTAGRRYNMNPSYHSGGGMVNNSNTTVNANINLTGSGSTEQDARSIIRGINREAHRGGLRLTNS